MDDDVGNNTGICTQFEWLKAKPGKNNHKLICLDWDETLLAGHSHNLLVESKRSSNNTSTLVQKIGYILKKAPPRARHQIPLIISDLLSQGCYVAITSFTKHDYIIKPILATIGLSEGCLAQIYVVGGYPLKTGEIGKATSKSEIDEEAGKNLHIQKAIEHFKCSNLPRKNIILIDDSQNNCTMASTNGYTVSLVPKHNVHLSQWENDKALIDAIQRVIGCDKDYTLNRKCITSPSLTM